jgi:TonB family protein
MSTHAVVASKLDIAPAPIDQIRPVYPSDLKNAGVSGHVIVDFIVDDQGNVLNASASGATRPEFENPAVQAVSQWVFRPGAKNGFGVSMHVQVPIVFGSDNIGEVPHDPAGQGPAVTLSVFYVKG